MPYNVLILCYYPNFSELYLEEIPSWKKMYESISTSIVPYNEWNITAVGPSRGGPDNIVQMAHNYMDHIGINKFVWHDKKLDAFISANDRKKYDLIIDEFCPLAEEVKSNMTSSIRNEEVRDLLGNIRTIIPSLLKRNGKFITFFWGPRSSIKKRAYSWVLWDLINMKKELIVTNENRSWNGSMILKEYQKTPKARSLSRIEETKTAVEENRLFIDIQHIMNNMGFNDKLNNSEKKKILKLYKKDGLVPDIQYVVSNIINDRLAEQEKKITAATKIARTAARAATEARAATAGLTRRSISPRAIQSRIIDLKKKANSNDVIKAQAARLELIKIETKLGRGVFKKKKTKRKKSKRKNKRKKSKRKKSKRKNKRKKSKRKKSKRKNKRKK